MKRTRLERRTEKGFFTIWMVGLCAFIMLIGGIGLDLWHGLSDRQQLSNIADSAAIAGAAKIDLNCFKQDSKLVLNDPAKDGCPDGDYDGRDRTAVDRANDYIDEAVAENNLTLTNRDVEIGDDGQLNVSLSMDTDTILTRLFKDPTKKFTLTVNSSAAPRAS